MLLCNLGSTDWSPVPQWKHCRVNALEQHVCRTVSLHDSNCCLRTHTRPSLSCHHCRSLACKRLRLSENTSSVTVPWMFSFSHFSDMIMTHLSAQSPIQSMLLTTARICKKSMQESHPYCQNQSDTQTLFFHASFCTVFFHTPYQVACVFSYAVIVFKQKCVCHLAWTCMDVTCKLLLHIK